MTDNDGAASEAADQEAAGSGDLEAQLAQELVERARERGVSMVGPDGLLAGVTRTVLQTALDAEMTEAARPVPSVIGVDAFALRKR